MENKVDKKSVPLGHAYSVVLERTSQQSSRE